MEPSEIPPHDRARQVAESKSDSFVELIKIARLDPNRDLRFSNWSGISFKGLDLRGFDFTGSRLVECDFADAQIKGARFEAADIKGANLRNAKDWSAYVESWTPPKKPLGTRHLRVGAEFQDAPFGPQMVIVPQGEFLMGSPVGEGYESEHPQHQVTIEAPFAVSVSPVMRGEFAAFVQATKHKINKGETAWRSPRFPQEDDHPVVDVSWHDAHAYVAWLKKRSGGKPYRLLSEAEWEYCCRAGTTSAYSTGESVTPAQASFGGNAEGTTSVFTFPPNAWGLRDMHGSVWEWCEDSWHDDYSGDSPTDGPAWRGGDTSSRVQRGGSWSSIPQFLRSANRRRGQPDFRENNVGFRVARTL
jgi:formylglycine-generating enzyme required for sulfatase activity